MNERTAKMSHGWRRVKRRMRNLIRKNRRIANTPEIALSRSRPAVGIETGSARVVPLEDDDETATLQSA
jgi:hypothetical protein